MRQDLRCSFQRDASGEICVIKDPVGDRYFRTGRSEWHFAQLLDGTRTLEEAVGAFGGGDDDDDDPWDIDDAEEFAGALGDLGFLEGVPGVAEPRAARWWANPFFIRVPLGDPNRLLGKLARVAGPLFHPGFVGIASIAIAGGVVLAIAHLGALRTATESLLAWPGLVYLWIPALAMTAVHELAHGATCRRFDGEVHDIGVVLYYFQPCAYCDVSDAWMIESRARRLWVIGAGPFFEMFLWAVATGVWVLLPAGSVASNVALGIAATSGLRTLFNLNPLLKLDGYYLLSDGLGIPNLRARAFGYIRNALRRDPPDVTRIERVTFLLYAPLAALYTLAAIGVFGVWLYSLLLDAAGLWGHAAFWGVVALLALPALLPRIRRAGADHRQRRSHPRESTRTAPK